MCCYPPPRSATRGGSIGVGVGSITVFVDTKKFQMWLLPPLIWLHELPWKCAGGRFLSHYRAIGNPHDGGGGKDCSLLLSQ